MELRRCMGCMELVSEAVCPHCGYDSGKQNDSHQLPVGTVLNDQYMVGRVLGQGGFGITYIGWDIRLEMVVAIKEFFPGTLVFRDHSISNSLRSVTQNTAGVYAAGKERFLREARALSRLRSIPEIVDIYSLIEENNTAYIIMEFIRGTELKDYVAMKGGRLSAEETLRILEPVVTALAKVHQSDLVHRDISPDNIMLHPMGGAKLLDFGAVRHTESSNADADLAHSTEAIVKHGFAPMEQYRNRGGLGPWTDEYALCASFYYCLTGQVPPDAMSRSMGEEIDWSIISGLTETQLEALQKGMSFRAKDRFGNLEELHRALYRKEPAPIPKEPPREKKAAAPRKKRKAALATAAIAAVAVIGILAGLWLQPAKENDPVLQEPIPSAAPQIPEPSPLPTVPAAAPSEAPTMPPTEPSEAPAEPEIQPWENNVLKKDPFAYPLAMTTVTFLDTLAEAPDNATDVSQNQDGSVLLWMNGSDCYIAGEGGVNGAIACEGLFMGCCHVKQITFGGAFHTEQTTSMNVMFNECWSLEAVDVENLDTRNVTSMGRMFELYNYRANDLLKTLDVSNWDVSQVTTMYGMFSNREGLASLPVENWDVSNVTTMKSMFYGCTGLKSLNTENWDVSNVTTMESMFQLCDNLTELSTENWNVSGVTNMQYMFHCCSSLTSIATGNWDVSNVTTMKSMFGHCSSLETLDVSRWDVSSLQDADSLFIQCSNLKALDVSNWNVSQVSRMCNMFENCDHLTALDVTKWDVSQVTTMFCMFSDCDNLEAVDVSKWDISNVTTVSHMFFSCEKLLEPDVSAWNKGKLTDYSNFYYSTHNQNWDLLFG